MYSFRCFAVAALALCVIKANGFWRLECQGSTGLARLDPLMSYNSIGQHVHSIKGGSGRLSKTIHIYNANALCG